MRVRLSRHRIITGSGRHVGWVGASVRLYPPTGARGGAIYQTVTLYRGRNRPTVLTEVWQVYDDGTVEYRGRDFIGIRVPAAAGTYRFIARAWYERGPPRIHGRGATASGVLRSRQGVLRPRASRTIALCRHVSVRVSRHRRSLVRVRYTYQPITHASCR